MKKIKVKFLGFWPEFDKNNNFFINILRKRYVVELSDNPEYVISSCFSDEYLNYDCIRIFYTGECVCPDFNVFDYAIAYENISYEDRYFRLPNYHIDEIYQRDCQKMLVKHLNNEIILKEKEEFCSFVVSKGNGYVDKKREQFFRQLSEYKRVNSGGRYLNNIGEAEGVKDKLAFQAKHKFAIAFENTSHPGYVTEKIVQAFAAKTIPIYWGDPLVGKTFNPKAFIDCTNTSQDEIVKLIKQIDNDDNLYLKMLNEPALIDEKCFYQEKIQFEEYLWHIFDQPYEMAQRRDLVGYGKKQNDKLKKQFMRDNRLVYRGIDYLYNKLDMK